MRRRQRSVAMALAQSPARGTSALTTMTACRSSGARGLTASLASCRRSESRGASWSRSSTQHRSFLFSTILILCRRWWTPWWKSVASSSYVGRWLPSKLGTVWTSWFSKCPRIFSTRLRPPPLFLSRRQQNSWLQCLGSSSLSSDVLKAHSAWPSRALLGKRGPCLCMTLGATASPRRYINTGHRYVSAAMQRHIPAVFAEQWMVPLHFFDRVVDIAVMLQRQVVVQLYIVVDTHVIAQMRIPIVLEILQLQYIDKVVDVCSAGSCTPVVCNDRCRG